jgi:hypothetical protein
MRWAQNAHAGNQISATTNRLDPASARFAEIFAEAQDDSRRAFLLSSRTKAPEVKDRREAISLFMMPC